MDEHEAQVEAELANLARLLTMIVELLQRIEQRIPAGASPPNILAEAAKHGFLG